MKIRRFLLILLLLSVIAPLGTGSRGNAADAGGTEAEPMKMGDPELDVLWIDEKNGEYIPLDTVFRDENGETVTLAQLIDKPTVILPIYFYCPSSCSLNLMNLATAIKRSRLKPGTDYEVIAFSFNEEENDEDAGRAKKNYLRLLPREFPEEKWKFLTGTKESIESLTQAIGYTFKPLSDGTFVHPSALLVVAADGMIIKYVYGTFATGDVDMAITEAKRGTPAVSIKRFLSYCFNYDPRKSRSLFQNIKIAVAFGFAALGICFIFYLRKTGRKK